MKYCKNYCVEKGISTSKLNEAQSTLYYIAENMKINKSISEEGYRHFQMAIKALSQEPTSEMVHVETLHQVMWERDIAIGQLKELGYDFGQKIELCDDAISRDAVIEYLESNVDDFPDYHEAIEKVLTLPPVTQKSGKWIDYRDDGFVECPNCGADMRGGTE